MGGAAFKSGAVFKPIWYFFCKMAMCKPKAIAVCYSLGHSSDAFVLNKPAPCIIPWGLMYEADSKQKNDCA